MLLGRSWRMLALALAAVPGLAAWSAGSPASAPRPVLLVPGDGGNQLEARLEKSAHTPHWYCPRSSHGRFERLWLRASDLLPGLVGCWSDNVRLHWDAATGAFADTPGVEVRVPGFGNTSTVEVLDPALPTGSGYLDVLVGALVAGGGYERGESVAAAPYDFRRTPRSNRGYVARTARLVERLFAASGGRRVALVSHSLGSLVTLYLLNEQPQTWKDRYIHSWTSVAGVFAGTALELKVLASGDSSGVKVLPSRSLVEEQRSYETNVWMLPRAGSPAWPAERALLRRPGREYTVDDLDDAFFADIGYPRGAAVRAATSGLSRGLPAPGVRVHVVVGTGVPTPVAYNYTKGCEKTWFRHDPTATELGDGDGTVNLPSLLAPVRAWRAAAELAAEVRGGGAVPVAVTVTRYPGVSHGQLIRHPPLIAALLEYLRADDPISISAPAAQAT